MSISINEFKANIVQYLLLAKTEDLFIRLDGDVVMRLTNTKRDRRKIAEQLNSYRITTSPSKAWWLSLFKK